MTVELHYGPDETVYVAFDGVPVFRLTVDGRFVDAYGRSKFEVASEMIVHAMGVSADAQ